MTPSSNQAPPTPADVWSSGDYAGVSDRMIPDLGARLVALADVRPGERVLDVAAGVGNATLPAARAGAVVTALDITPSLVQTGARRAAAAGLDVTWVCGDAHELPFADDGFELVMSCVGVQFCADARTAAAELVRVCSPGGRVALIAWTPDGFIGRVLAAISEATGRGSCPAALAWGEEDGLTELFGEAAAEISTSRARVGMPAESAAEWVDDMSRSYGPMLMARSALEAKQAWEPVRARLCEIAAEHDVGGGGGFTGEADYLAAVLQLR